MLTSNIPRHIKKHKRLVILVSILIFSLVSCLGYIQYRVSKNEKNQKAIVEYLKKNLDREIKDKIESHAIVIQLKIDKYKKTGNLYVDSYVINMYTTAQKMAEEGIQDCYTLEHFGDDMSEAYRQGKKDADKYWASQNNSF